MSVTILNPECNVILMKPGYASYIIQKKVNNVTETINNGDRDYYYDWNDSGDKIEYCYIAENSVGERIKSNWVMPGENGKDVTNVAVLMYHYFCTDEDLRKGGLKNGGTVSVDEFEADLKYFKENGIRTITSSELIQFWNGEIDLPEKCVMITIDDGHYSVYKYVRSLLETYNCKANVAVIGEFASKRSIYRSENPQKNYWMTWEEISELAKLDCFEFGSHSNFMHNATDGGRYGTRIMEGESEADYRNALLNDNLPLNAKLLDACGYSPTFFAYPYNDPCDPSRSIMVDDLGMQVLMVGNSPYFCKTNGNCFVKGISQSRLESHLMRRFARHAGDDIGALLTQIWETDKFCWMEVCIVMKTRSSISESTVSMGWREN